MADKNEKNNSSKASNDISEMLRLLRESVDADRRVESEREPVEKSASDEEIRSSLERIFEEIALDTPPKVEEEVDQFEVNETDSWFALEDEDEEEPADEETIEDEPVEEDEAIKEEPEEEDPDNDDPWYSDEEEPVDEETIEDEPVEEDEAIEEEPIEEAAEDESGWYAIETESEETDTADEIPEEIPSEDESVWYSEEEVEPEDEPAEEVYQDEDFDDDDGYDEDIEELTEENETEDAPEDDYDEEDVYIYDAEREEREEYLYNESAYEEEAEEDEEPDDNGIDETDIGFINALGIASDEEAASEADADDYAGDISYDYDGGEYVLENQRYEISAGYRNEKKRTIVRLALGGAFALLLLIYETLSAFGVTMPGMLEYSEFPVSYVMISLQGLFLCILLSAKQLYIGAADLVHMRATPYSVSAAIVAMNVIYSAGLAIAQPDVAHSFNCIGAFSIVAAIAYEYMLLISEEHTFGVFSGKKGQKYAFVTEEAIETDADGRLSLSACSTEFNKNYFSRMRKRSEDYKYLTYLVLSVLGASILTFLISLICKAGIGSAMENGVMVANIALPVGVFGAFSYPIFRASTKALGNRGAFVGGGAIDEYSKTRFVTFSEEELFTSLKTAHVDLRPSGNENISDVLCKTSVLLSAIGGSMKRMVEVMHSGISDSNVVIDEIFDDGISARADGVEMLAGSAQFLRNHGVEVETVNSFKDNDGSNEVLYVSIDGKLAARYYLKYKADPEFIKLVNELGARGVSVGIRTVNPAVNSDIIARRCQGLRYKIYTIKAPVKTKDEAEMRRATTDSGIVALGRSLCLAYPLLACCDIKTYYKVDMFVRIASAAIGSLAVIINATTAGGTEGALLMTLLYQVAWFLPTVLFGVLHFNHRSKKKKFKIVYR